MFSKEMVSDGTSAACFDNISPSIMSLLLLLLSLWTFIYDFIA